MGARAVHPRASCTGAGPFLLRHHQDPDDRELGAIHLALQWDAPDDRILPEAPGAVLVTMRQVPFFDLTIQYLTIREEIDAAMSKVLRSGWFILGEEVATFEREFAAYCGTAHGIGVASGTEALQLALMACWV